MRLIDILNENINKKQMISNYKSMGVDKEQAESELENLIDYVKSLPDTVKLYRIISVDSKEDIDTEKLGSHYATNKRDLLSSHSFVSEYGENQFLVTVKAPKSLIDMNETIANNILYPNENEITLKKKGKGVEIISIRKVTN